MTSEEKRIREREVGVRVLGLGLVVRARVVGLADVDLEVDVGDLGGRGRLGFGFLDDGWTG